MNTALAQAIKHWDYIAPLLEHPKNEKAFNKLVAQLDELLTIVGDNENHRLIGLIDILSDLIANYEAEHYSDVPANQGVAALQFLMEAHQLKQSDLPEIGSQGVVSEILNGKRSLNLRQIKLLAERFGVTPATFMD